jgi:hypothetical protein
MHSTQEKNKLDKRIHSYYTPSNKKHTEPHTEKKSTGGHTMNTTPIISLARKKKKNNDNKLLIT